MIIPSGVANMKLNSYPKIRPIGHIEIVDFLENKDHEVVITEKLDGANFRFTFELGRIYFGTRNYPINPDEEKSSGWITTIEYIRSIISQEAISKYDEFTFFGEAMKKHAIDYNWKSIPKFIGFEIVDSNGNWLDHDQIEAIFSELGLTVVPVINRCKISELDIDKLQKPIPSHFRVGFAEGIVIKDQMNASRAKIVFDLPAEKKQIPKEVIDSTDDSSLVRKYANYDRISKIILNFIDEGKALEMSLMKDLPKAVWIDIVIEDYFEILTSNWKLDLKNVRKLITNASKNVLLSKIEEEGN